MLSSLLTASIVMLSSADASQNEWFAIKVVDEQTGRGVPLVELRTVHDVTYVTDSNGIVAFAEPGLMDQRVFFHIASHGYEYAKDGFGYRGAALTPKAGEMTQLKIKRLNVAERLYRVTGAGIYRDTVLVGQAPPIQQPLLNGMVLGSDSVLNVIYRGKIHWFWGDTNFPGYPLGNFNVPGATSELPSAGGLDPSVGVNLTYFLDDKARAKATAPVPGPGPTWLHGLMTVPGSSGDEEMYASYAKIKPPMTAYERGLVQFDDRTKTFHKVLAFDPAAPIVPHGHPFKAPKKLGERIYFANPYPLLRVRATTQDVRQISSYETYTCLKEGSDVDKPKIDRDADGKVRYSWKKNVPVLEESIQKKLVGSGALKPEECLLQLRDHATGKRVQAHGGSVYWNEYRKRWVMITVEMMGTSMVGEVWYAEADRPTGPWVYATKVVTHDKYSFYNPKQHPMFDQDGGRIVYFEGTYTDTFSGSPKQTPRYNYNQVMYRLDLADSRLNLPVAVYRQSSEKAAEFEMGAEGGTERQIAFFALDRPGEETMPIYQWREQEGVALGAVPPAGAKEARILFHTLKPEQSSSPPASTRPLYEHRGSDGKRRAYSTDPTWSEEGLTRSAEPVCLVWHNPLTSVTMTP